MKNKVKQWVIRIPGNRHGAPSDGTEAQTERFPLALEGVVPVHSVYLYWFKVEKLRECKKENTKQNSTQNKIVATKSSRSDFQSVLVLMF